MEDGGAESSHEYSSVLGMRTPSDFRTRLSTRLRLADGLSSDEPVPSTREVRTVAG